MRESSAVLLSSGLHLYLSATPVGVRQVCGQIFVHVIMHLPLLNERNAGSHFAHRLHDRLIFEGLRLLWCWFWLTLCVYSVVGSQLLGCTPVEHSVCDVQNVPSACWSWGVRHLGLNVHSNVTYTVCG
jgi:hypothetical protein